MSLGPKRSIEKKTFLEIAVFKMTKHFGPVFVVLSSVRRLTKQFCEGAQAITIITVEIIGAFFWDLRDR